VRRSSASLGTVIGVMITFAAIAASGDVNVNTIARDSGGARLYRGRAGRRDPDCLCLQHPDGCIREQLTAMDVYGEDAVTRAALVLRQAARTGARPMRFKYDTKVYDEINVTPLLDLAWNLLIIFMVMATATVQGIRSICRGPVPRHPSPNPTRGRSPSPPTDGSISIR
jgi:hypothetical protein